MGDDEGSANVKRARSRKWAVLLMGVTLPGITGACFPKGYLPSSIETLSVALADNFFSALLEAGNEALSGTGQTAGGG